MANIVVGVAGGIAAYKACHLVRYFTESGHNVTVIPTESALNFVGSATFEALSGNPVSTSVFTAVDTVRHVALGQQADLVVIAPATADLIARIAAGRADDLLTSTVLTATCPIVVAPAMHTEMWLNPATQDNVATLRRRGLTIIPPAHGRLTGKDTGPGRLPEPSQIGELALTILNTGALPTDCVGQRVLITAGGTQEDIDPVRYIGNRSSGRQSFALAEIAVARGAESVTIVRGSTEDLPTPPGATIVPVRSARDMHEITLSLAADATLIICAAAVADYRPAQRSQFKLKKHGGAGNKADLTHVELVENPDILRSLVEMRESGRLASETTIVGFAAETGDDTHSVVDLAAAKLQRKGCDVLVCNDVADNKVFGQPHNSCHILAPQGVIGEVAQSSKQVVARRIFDAIVDHVLR